VLNKIPILNVVEVHITLQGILKLMFLFVLDNSKKLLNPTHSARARKLLKLEKASAFKRYPLTIIWQEEVSPSSNQQLRIKIAPGARTTSQDSLALSCLCKGGSFLLMRKRQGVPLSPLQTPDRDDDNAAVNICGVGALTARVR
jgi:RRXRR protein